MYLFIYAENEVNPCNVVKVAPGNNTDVGPNEENNLDIFISQQMNDYGCKMYESVDVCLA